MRTSAVALLCLSAAAAAGEGTRDRVAKLLAAADDAERARLVDELVKAAPDAREAAAAFAAGRAYAADVPKGWLETTARGGDGKERPCLLHVPQDYAPGKKHRLVVDLHGGVSRPAPLTHQELEQMKFFWADEAEARGWLLAIPSGEKGAEWWTPAGAGTVLSVLADARRTYNVDEDRVYATGFSDGGSGSFHLALVAPSVLAGIVPLNGHPSVAQAGGLQVHLRNFANVPCYAINTENDQLYPSASVKPIFDAMKELGANLTWRDVAGFGHDPRYLPGERPAIVAWMDRTPRDPQPARVVWEGTGPSRVAWLEVTEVGGAGEGDADFPDVNPELPTARVRIGVTVDPVFGGPGVRVTEVEPGMPASEIGLAPGDLLVGIDGAEIGGMPDLQAALRAKKAGDAFQLRFRRGEETHEKEGKFPEPRPEKAFRRGTPWGSLEATVKDNVVEVRARQVKAFDVLLCEPLFDLSKPVTVRVNGKTAHEGVVAPDLRFLAERAAADQDRTRILLARLKIAVPAR